MIRLVYSNRTEELVAELAARLRAQQLADGVLAPVPIVVQSRALDEYLRRGIARECGIAANLETMLITRFAATVIAEGGGARVAGADAIEAMALSLLLDDAFVAGADLEPVRAYLSAAPSGVDHTLAEPGTCRRADAIDVRRVQLAARVGRLFEEYTYSRGTELLVAWSRGTTLPEGPHAEAERWQRRMWLAMFGEKGLSRARGLVPLHEATGALDAFANPGAGRAVHVFGFAHFARTFHELLVRVARSREVVVYTLTPCEGFWEDYDPCDPPPIRLWGRPGREHVRALDARAGFDHDDRFVEPEGTLLARLQRDILHRERGTHRREDGASSGVSFDGDESIVLLEHASMRRELEAVASEIWRLVERDATLDFDEIAVLVPDVDTDGYLAHLQAVFGESRLLEAVDLLLALPLGRFTRQELLRFVVHPTVVASLDDVDGARWLGWCDSLGIVHGADRADHADTYIERDILNWDQGLRRLALGAFMTGDASGERRAFELGPDAYVPHELAASDLRDAGALGLLVRSLVADARFLRGAELSMPEWATLLVDLVGTYVSARTDREGKSLVACLRRLDALRDVDLGGRRVGYRFVAEIARRGVAAMSGQGGSEGVIVSRIGSVRPIPFRAVFACGMGEGRFPSTEAEDALDLRAASRLPGDVTARERDKYAFLELLLGTRERLYLSYVSRDPLTGDALARSSVVDELVHALRGYLRDPSALRCRHPLRRWDGRYFPDLFPTGTAVEQSLGTMALPEARAEAQALALRRGFEHSGARVDRAFIESRAASDPAWASLADHLRLGRVSDGRAPEGARALDARIAIPMYALVKFLEFPLQGWARFRVGLGEFEGEDSLAREDEPFETDLREETLLLRAVFFAAAKGRPFEQVYEETVRDRELRGSGPSGLFVDAERGEHLQTLEAWRDGLAALEIPTDGIEVHRFGRAGEHATADRVHAALTLEVDVADPAGAARIVVAEIGGRTLPVGAPDASLTMHRRAKETRDEWSVADRQRAHLRAFVDHAVLSASGIAEGRPRASVVVVATPDGRFSDRIVFEPLSRGEALVWLRNLVRELLGGPHAYFLPCEAVLVDRRRSGDGRHVHGFAGASSIPGRLRVALEDARDLLGDSEGPLILRSAYGPVPRPHKYPLPAEADARAMIAVRFGPLFDKWRPER